MTSIEVKALSDKDAVYEYFQTLERIGSIRAMLNECQETLDSLADRVNTILHKCDDGVIINGSCCVYYSPPARELVVRPISWSHELSTTTDTQEREAA